jgi:ubiquinone/menaquinone biosynthesis C-methylase UbiE
VVALDSNLASLKRLAAEARRRGLANLLPVCADAAKPPLQSEFFDTVLCIEVLYLASGMERNKAISIPVRLLKSDGTMIVVEFTRFGRAIIDLDAMASPFG